MATLEIHEVGQRVRRVRIGRSHPVMVGTNPICDVQLNDPSVRSFHGRIRWNQANFKVEAVGEVPYVEVNGRKVKSKSLRQGDEVRVGHTRIFLLTIEDDGPDHGEKTVVQETPLSSGFARPTPAAGQPSGRTAPPPRPSPEYHKMEMAPPSLELSSADLDDPPEDEPTGPRPATRAGDRPAPPRSVFDDLEDLNQDDPEDQAEAASTSPAGRRATSLSWPRRLIAVLRGVDRPPDDERVLTSPTVIGLAATFVVLVGLSFGLYRIIVQNEARQRFAAATDRYERGDFRGAIQGYDAYLRAEPAGAKAGKARVYRSLARVRQHTAASSGSWNNASKEAEAMLRDVSTLPEYRDVSVDLAAEVRKTAEGMLDRARDLADNAWLTQARAAIALHARIAGTAAAPLLARSTVPAKLDQAQAAIRKATDLNAAITAVDAAIASNHPAAAYHLRSALLQRYPDLASNKDLNSRLTRINDLVRAAVRFDPSERPGRTDTPAEPLGPPTSLVYRLDPAQAADRSGPVAFALADGWAWGFDGVSGAPLWQVAVGLASPFVPVRVEGGTGSALMIDARSNELVHREARSGRLIWRQTLEGWATDPPLVLGFRVLQPLVDGRLLEIDLRTGDLRGTLRLGRRITRSLVVSESAEQAYLLGDEDCLFDLDLDPLGCTSVEFLGHDAGTVACTPTRAGRLFILPENRTLDSGRWRVFLMGTGSGNGFRPTQEVPIGGWTWGSPVAAGSVLWSASDRGEVVAFAIGRLDAPNPLAPIARLAPGPATQGPAFPQARSEREFTVASGLSARYDLDIDRGKLVPVWTLGVSGHAIAPAQPVGRLTVLTQQAEAGGGASVWGVDSTSGEVRWRTVVGTPWPTRWAEAASGDAIATLLGDGRDLALPRDQLRAGGFVEQPLPRPGAADLINPGAERIEVNGTTLVIPTADANQVLVRESSGEYRAVSLPARLAAPPLPVGRNLLVPGSAGRVYLVDPQTGLSAADPYVPPFDRARPTRWRAPVALVDDACVVTDSEGTLRRLTIETAPRPRLVVAAERKLDSPPLGDPASTGPALVVATADLKVRSFSARDLSPLGAWPIATPPTVGPVVVAGFCFVVDAAGQVLALDGDGRHLWTATLREPRVTGPPVVRDHAAWFVSRDQGSVEALSLTDGTSLGPTRIEAEPTAGPVAADIDLILSTGQSTWQTFIPRPAPGGSPP